jgi:hypothetical protein
MQPNRIRAFQRRLVQPYTTQRANHLQQSRNNYGIMNQYIQTTTTEHRCRSPSSARSALPAEYRICSRHPLWILLLPADHYE